MPNKKEPDQDFFTAADGGRSTKSGLVTSAIVFAGIVGWGLLTPGCSDAAAHQPKPEGEKPTLGLQPVHKSPFPEIK